MAAIGRGNTDTAILVLLPLTSPLSTVWGFPITHPKRLANQVVSESSKNLPVRGQQIAIRTMAILVISFNKQPMGCVAQLVSRIFRRWECPGDLLGEYPVQLVQGKLSGPG